MAAEDGAERYAAVVLAGGGGRRLGGVDKPALTLGGRSLLTRVLDAVADAEVRIVVGPPRELPPGVLSTREQPPGAGPIAGIAAGLALVPVGLEHIALFAGDLPFLTAEAVRELRVAAAEVSAAYVDDQGRRQYLCAVWRTGPLRERLHAVGDPEGVPLRRLYDDALVTEVHSRVDPPPWYDCDTQADLDRARRWLQPGEAGPGPGGRGAVR